MTGRMVLEAVGPAIGKLGFKKRAGEIFTIELEDDVLGWIGLNRATQNRLPGEVEINPVIGVRHQGVERIVAELREEKFHAYQPPTVSTPLGYLLPEARYKAWIFSSACAADAANEMVDAIAACGLPFMRAMTRLDDLCLGLESRLGFEHQLIYRRPAAYFLAGKVAQAEKALDASLIAVGSRNDIAATEFRSFAVAFKNRLSSYSVRVG